MTFYSFLGISPNANQEDINKAYRKLSRTLHPDKARSNWLASYNVPKRQSTKPGAKPTVHVHKHRQPSASETARFNKEASARFERLSLIVNVLRGPERERYDHFLRNGFPAWRGTGYYYERFRPGLGTVLIGLFLFGGGAVHYAALYVSYRRQREFVDRYVRHARRTAWGDEGSIGAIPGLDGTSAPAPAPAATESDESMQWNRKQKRAMEKEKRKEAKNPSKAKAAAAEKARTSGISTPVEADQPGPVGAKKRTVAENGKVLIVDSVGNVFLEEVTAEGERQEFLLDVSCPIRSWTVTSTDQAALPSPMKCRSLPSPIQSSCDYHCSFTTNPLASSLTDRHRRTLLGKSRESRLNLMRPRHPCNRPFRPTHRARRDDVMLRSARESLGNSQKLGGRALHIKAG